MNNFGLNIKSTVTNIFPYGTLNPWKSYGIISQNSGKKEEKIPCTSFNPSNAFFIWILEKCARKLAVTTCRLILEGKCLLNSHGFTNHMIFIWLVKEIYRMV